MADGLFGLYGLEFLGQVIHRYPTAPPAPPLFHVPNRLYVAPVEVKPYSDYIYIYPGMFLLSAAEGLALDEDQTDKRYL